MQPFTAVLTDGRVVVPQQSEADSLMNDGYGTRAGGLLVLEPSETLFNVERGKIMVVDEKTNSSLSLSELLRVFLETDAKAWTRFLVYRDLRTRGFVARRDPEGLTDLVVYERGAFKKEPPNMRVAIVSEGSPESLERLHELARGIEREGLQLKLAVVDRRGEMVYYGLSERKLRDVVHEPV
jgi:tRNA-intron endonuclease